ncbi:hypothetical protein [Amycolatopsis sp. SID8362]|uniref:hypothetical protein n=1 Tax=Amycolatopsis sp. SID8362 TaxID=2690346 RepID=UPI0013700FAB|nr:hypothetical protein [Amycolatopsis sp. SID8362]NBH10271.1 hypothetical protein [Amycolatopsis sp. SID8362]NED46966.1 hypothetical protein [Amycolatopsis sp. SID8362]
MSGGFGFPAGCVAAVVAVVLADVAGATRFPWFALVTLGLVVLLTAFRSTAAAAIGVAAVAWALHSGFVLGRAGELRFDAASAVAAGVLGVTVLVGILARVRPRRAPVRVPSPRRPVAHRPHLTRAGT